MIFLFFTWFSYDFLLIFLRFLLCCSYFSRVFTRSLFSPDVQSKSISLSRAPFILFQPCQESLFKNSEIFEPLGLEMKVDFFSAGSFDRWWERLERPTLAAWFIWGEKKIRAPDETGNIFSVIFETRLKKTGMFRAGTLRHRTPPLSGTLKFIQVCKLRPLA